MTTFIDVAAAAIVNAENKVLIAKRAAHRHQGDRWEFPGGKLDAGEVAEQALVRECFPHHGAQREDIRSAVERRGAGLLGRHVRDRPA